MKGCLHFVFAPVCRPTCVLFANQRWTCCGIPSRYYRLTKLPSEKCRFQTIVSILGRCLYRSCRAAYRATEFSRQVLLSFPSQSSKFRAPTALCRCNSKMSFAGYRVINVLTHMNRIHAAISLYPCGHLSSPGMRLFSGICRAIKQYEYLQPLIGWLHYWLSLLFKFH